MGINSSLAAAVGDDMSKVTAALVAEHAAAGDPFCSELMRRTGSYLGSAIATLVNTLNPEIVAIGGGVSRAGELLLQPIRESYREKAIKHVMDSVQIIPAQLDKDAGPRGAAALVIDRLMV
jgi:glucokinase